MLTPSSQNDSTVSASAGDAPQQPTTPRSPGSLRNARDNMSLSTSRSPSLASRVRHRPSDTPNTRPKHNFARTLVINRGIYIQGTIQDAEKIVIEGTVETERVTAKELVIEHGGRFQGTADVEVAEISGILDGELTAKSSLQVCATGRLNGNASCRRLQVDDGGEISGKIDMLTNNTSASHAAPSHEDIVDADSDD